MLVLSEEEVETLLPISECINSMEEAFKDWGQGKAANMPRYRLPLHNGALQVLAGSSIELEVTGLKTYVTGSKTGTQMVVLLYSTKTGEPIAMLHSNKLGQIRTGAASGLATKYLTDSRQKIVSIIGSGFQAETQLAAIHAVRDIKHVYVYSRNKTNRENFADKMSKKLNIEIEPVESAEMAVENSNVICTITNSREPVFDGKYLNSGTHINAAGSNHWARRELDLDTIERCKVVVCDDIENAKSECGELIWAAERRKFSWDQAFNLRDLISSRIAPENFIHSNANTLFESQGLGIEDVYAGMYVYEKALQAGMGKKVNF
ncbi:MAG: hypothetical protein CL763_06580 [Chloroflexi bacterium]|nr:hypothetical protein [Chloroflexota bacterium]|tara:strand:- start:2397 stop:3356 length:960 start_codon:yes stop_codon:yes gene_type:complete